MKTIKTIVCIGTLLFGMHFSYAQLKVTSSGGVKIGSQPQMSGIPLSWKINNKGLEVNAGDIVFHASNGASISFKSYENNAGSRITGINPSVPDPGLPNVSEPIPLNYSVLTGWGLCVGSGEDPIWQLNTKFSYTEYGENKGSDRRMKKDIVNITDAKQYIMNLRPVTYDLIPTDEFFGDSNLLKNKAGFIAQEVLDVLPGAVGYMENIDRYTLDYTHFIPYLTQMVQEQENEIQSLKNQLKESNERLQAIETILGINTEEVTARPASRAPKANVARLYQNVPNPTRENTTIRYELPGECSAKIVVTAVDGRMVKAYRLPCQNGIGEIEISKHDLGAGVYSYSLFVNDELVETRRMIFAE